MMSSNSLQTRERILEATLELLQTGKHSATRLSDIAKKAGISRQAVYLHFSGRTELLIAATRYVEKRNAINAALAPSRNAMSGIERLDAYIVAWSRFLPKIEGLAKALIAMSETDAAAAEAWNGRMQAMRDGCAAAVAALADDDHLSQEFSQDQATDILYTLLSVPNWIHLRNSCGWSTESYCNMMQLIARKLLLDNAVLCDAV